MTDTLVPAADARPTPMPGSVETRAFEVTLFEDRALVSREATVRVVAGRQRVSLLGCGVALDDTSVRVISRTPSTKALSSYVHRAVRSEPAASAEDLENLENEDRTARQELLEATACKARTMQEETRLQNLLAQWARHMASVPVGGRETLEQWHKAYRILERKHHQILEERHQASQAMETARLNRVGAELRLRIARTVQHRLEARVDVYLDSAEAGDVVLVLTYRTPCAAWRPEHRARLHPGREGTPDRVEVSTWATIWQATGEVWKDVRCCLSTARPTQQAAASPVTDDVLSLRPKTEAEKQSVVVEARDQAVAVAGLARGQREVSDMPGVDDGGEPVVMESVRPATLPADGRPVRIEVSTTTMEGTVDRIGYPELGEGVYVRALATWNGSVPLLAGPVRLVGGEAAVGLGRTGYIARGEPFEMGFGVDDSLRVRQSVQRTRDVVPLLGTQKVSIKVTDTVSNLSDRARSMTLVERVPRSDLADLKITVKADGATFNEENGIVRWEVSLAPNEVRTIQWEYRIEAGPKVQLPSFLGG